MAIFVVGFSNHITRHCPDDLSLQTMAQCGYNFWFCGSCEEGLHTLRSLFTRFSNHRIPGTFMFFVGPLNENANLHGLPVLTRVIQNNSFVFFNAVPSRLHGINFTRSGLRCLGFCDGDEQNKPDNVRVSEVKWSLLPDLVLLIIRDKLDVFDDMRMRAVCRDWWLVSARYPKQSVGDGVPWVMQCNTFSTVRNFTSVERNKKFTVDMPEFQSARLLFSRHGWILFLQLPRLDRDRGIVLVNPFTKATIKMPHLALEKSNSTCLGCFSSHKGYPQCVVVLFIDCLGNKCTVQTAFPGGQAWTKNSYNLQRSMHGRSNGLLTIGGKVYYIDREGNMIIYDIVTQLWKEVPSCRKSVRCHIFELEGHLLQLQQCSKRTPYAYRVLRYNDIDDTWEQLETSDLNDINWFVREEGNCYALRKQGQKAYILPPKTNSNFFLHPPERGYNSACSLHDLVRGVTNEIGCSYSLHFSDSWVDIG